MARLALDVSLAVLPSQRTKFSKRQFTRLQLISVLCLMRYEDWTFRKAEVGLSEHVELQSMFQLNSVSDYTTLYCFLTRLREEGVARANRGGCAAHAEEKGKSGHCGGGCHWIGAKPDEFLLCAPNASSHTAAHTLGIRAKWLTVVDVDRQLFRAQSTPQGPWNHCTNLSPWSPMRINIPR